MIKSLYYVLCIYGCSLLILCSSSDGGLMYQCAVRELLIINYFLVHNYTELTTKLMHTIKLS